MSKFTYNDIIRLSYLYVDDKDIVELYKTFSSIPSKVGKSPQGIRNFLESVAVTNKQHENVDDKLIVSYINMLGSILNVESIDKCIRSINAAVKLLEYAIIIIDSISTVTSVMARVPVGRALSVPISLFKGMTEFKPSIRSRAFSNLRGIENNVNNISIKSEGYTRRFKTESYVTRSKPSDRLTGQYLMRDKADFNSLKTNKGFKDSAIELSVQGAGRLIQYGFYYGVGNILKDMKGLLEECLEDMEKTRNTLILVEHLGLNEGVNEVLNEIGGSNFENTFRTNSQSLLSKMDDTEIDAILTQELEQWQD